MIRNSSKTGSGNLFGYQLREAAVEKPGTEVTYDGLEGEPKNVCAVRRHIKLLAI